MNAFRIFRLVVFAIGFGGLFATTLASPAVRIEIADAAQPQLTVDAQGRVWLAYGRVNKPVAAPAHTAGGHAHGAGHGAGSSRPDGEIFVARSDDGGATFAPGILVARVPRLMLGMRRGPRIAAHDNRVTVTAIADELLAFHSSDGGRTWGERVVVNEVPACAREGLHDLAAGPDGRLFVTWLDLRNGTMELWGADSSDGGRTWSRNAPVYRSPDRSICECCHPTALFDAQGNLAVMWRNSVGGSRDMWMAVRASGAETFSPGRKIGEGSWVLNACPMDGGRLVALEDGSFGSVWQRAGEVFFAGASGPEIKVGKGKQPVAFVHDGRTTVVWQQGPDLVSVRVPGKEAPAKYTNDARFATVVPLPGGKGAVLAYEQGLHKASNVVVERH